MGLLLLSAGLGGIIVAFLSIVWDSIQEQRRADAKSSADTSFLSTGAESSVTGNGLTESEGTALSVEYSKDSSASS